MAHQHQVTVTDDRRQNVVEVVRDAARELSDHLHLGRLRDLPLELGFLTIVLEQEQDRRVAEAAEARYSQRDRLPALVSQPYRKVAGHRRPTRVTTDGIGHRGLVFLHHQIARIDRHDCWLQARRLAKRAVHGQESSIAIDQCKADRKHVEERLEVRRLANGIGVAAIEQQEGPRTAFTERIGGHMDHAKRGPRFPVRDKPHLLLVGEFHQIREAGAVNCLSGLDRPIGEQAIGGDHMAFQIYHGDENTRGREPLAGRTAHPTGSGIQRICSRRRRKVP